MAQNFCCAPFLVICLSLLLCSVSPDTLQRHSFDTFFKSLDLAAQGQFSLQQWADYYRRMEPSHMFDNDTLLSGFNLLDLDQDSVVTRQELLQMIDFNITDNRIGPKQIHISFDGQEGHMQVIWITKPNHAITPVVQYGEAPWDLRNTVYAEWSTYNVGHFGFHGHIYKAVMVGLKPLRQYFYRVGDRATGQFSPAKKFTAPPNVGDHKDEIRAAMFGDMGTFAPMGFAVSKQLQNLHNKKPIDFVFLTGDVAYAGMGSEKQGETEPIWDLFGELTEKWAANIPFLPGVGNHEKYYNYTSYRYRYVLPASTGSNGNLWFSFDYGQLHVIHFSSEHPYTKGSPQYDFLENDLARASANPRTKWIIVGVHRPFYNTNQFEYSLRTPLAVALEDLLVKYKVDIVQTGHVHAYERTWPVYNGVSQKQGCNQTFYISPKVPVYVVQGTAGALLSPKWVDPAPEWSVFRKSTYGVGMVTIKGNWLNYKFLSVIGNRVLDEWNIVK